MLLYGYYYGKVFPMEGFTVKISVCAVDGCGKSSAYVDRGRSGWCNMHYLRYRKYGDPTYEWQQSKPALDWIKEHVNSKIDSCITWPFTTGKDGYGRVHNPYQGNSITTSSRLMCIEAHGTPPHPKAEAAHKCGNGNKGCTNPNHLYWATPTMNQADRIAHGTSNRGERQGLSKLKEQDVIAIRRLLGTMSQGAIAKMFSIDPSVISDIKRRKLWAWLD